MKKIVSEGKKTLLSAAVCFGLLFLPLLPLSAQGEGITADQGKEGAAETPAEEAETDAVPKSDLETANSIAETLELQIQALRERLGQAGTKKEIFQETLDETSREIEELKELLESALTGAGLEVKTAWLRAESFQKEIAILQDEDTLRMREYPKYASALEKRRNGDAAGDQNDFDSASAHYQDAVQLFSDTIEEVRQIIAEEKRITEEKRRIAEAEREKAQEILRRTYGKYTVSRQ
ncbi:MAG: hypothetical protein LBG87_06350 [Spirochaetaceae bacterium]|jgi:hypothetical protein|nr:hypothetical protein [Spirochaetaceae bacterium]